MTESDVAVLVERIENLKKQVTDGQDRAEKWREHFDNKLSDRPCERHTGFFKAIDLQLKAIWAFIGAIIIALITEHFQRCLLEPKCQYHIGCHACPIEKLKEEMRMFRQAITQFLVEPQTHIAELRGMGYSLKNKIDEWYEPHTQDYKGEENGSDR